MRDLLLVSAGLLLGALVVLLLVSLLRRRSGPETLGRIEERLGLLDHIQAQVTDMAQLFLVARTRGVVGETLLTELLRAWLPSRAFELQYGLPGGQRADAAIHLADRVVCVDSKFPLEAIRRAIDPETGEIQRPGDIRTTLRKHARDIAAKYIVPSAGTLNFALMYLPSEYLYYLAFVREELGLLEETLREGVVPVGPSNLFLYLQTVAYGLRGLDLDRHKDEILKGIAALRKDFADYQKTMEKANTHLRNFSAQFDEGRVRESKLASIIERLERYEFDQ